MGDSHLNREASIRPDDVDLWSSEPITFPLPRPKLAIPDFPQFKLLAISDQYEIEQWVGNFLPYSDFNFVSLWSWNTSNECEVSWLNDNLVVLFNDYITGERFFSFIGATRVGSTAETLLDLASKRNMVTELRLIPEVTAVAFDDHPGLQVLPAPEHADYVLSTVAWSELQGKHFRNKRNEIRKFERDHDPECREIDLSDPDVQRQVLALYGEWIVERKQAGKPETVIESVAIGRVFALYRPQDLLTFGLYASGKMIGFSINERLKAHYSMGHFWKVVGKHPGAYSYLLRHTCRQLASEGITSHNIQQDLGEPGLATAKRSYQPQAFLGRYLIARDDSIQRSADPFQTERIKPALPVHEHIFIGGFASVG